MGAARVGGADIGAYKVRGNLCYSAGPLQVTGGDGEAGRLGVPGSLCIWTESR